MTPPETGPDSARHAHGAPRLDAPAFGRAADVIVVGGHAGVEATLAAARLGAHVVM